MNMKPEPAAAAIVLAAGNGSRAGAAHNKVFLPLAGRRVVSWSLHALAEVASISRFVLVIREVDRRHVQEMLDRELEGIDIELVVGGSNRHESELNALRHLAPAIREGDIDLVLLHDGARPLVSTDLIRRLISAAKKRGAVIPGLDAPDIMSVRADGTLDLSSRERIIRVQTPQVFEAGGLLEAYESAALEGFEGTDTSSCWQRYQGGSVWSVPGDARNIKVTYPGDLFLVDGILRSARFHLD